LYRKQRKSNRVADSKDIHSLRLPGRTWSALFSDFVEEKNRRDNKKDKAFC
jgi:hypothetical protein